MSDHKDCQCYRCILMEAAHSYKKPMEWIEDVQKGKPKGCALAARFIQAVIRNETKIAAQTILNALMEAITEEEVEEPDDVHVN